jgi:iron complex outermembrane receptor protein
MNTRVLSIWLLSTATCLLAEPCYAQDAQGSGSDGQAIVVTALKRDTSVLETPATVTVMSGTALAQHNLTEAADLNNVIPGLVVTKGLGSLPGVYFRGLGSNSSVFNLEPSVPIYQDGEYFGHQRDYVTPLYDVDHVELIKGNESTILGKNVSLGAISVVDKRPSDHFDYDLTIDHSAGIDGNKAEGGFTIPVSQDLSIRLAGIAQKNHGYIDNIYLGRSEPITEDLSGRVLIAYRPTDSFDVLFIYQHDRHRVEGNYFQVLADPTGAVGRWISGSGVAFPVPLGTPDYTASAQRALAGTSAGVEPFDNSDANKANLILNKDFNGVKLTFQSTYKQYNNPRAIDLDFSPANLLNAVDRERDQAETEELRLSTDNISRLNIIAGVFYYHDTWQFNRVLTGEPNTVGFAVTGLTNAYTRVNSQSISAYTSATYAITDKLKLDAGLRFTHERKGGEMVRTSTGVLAGAYKPIPDTILHPIIENPLDYNVGLRYQLLSNLMLYGDYGRASKSGSFQEFPTNLAAARFTSETVKSGEIGAKGSFPGGSAELALFHTVVDGLQTNYTSVVGTPPVTVIFVGNADVLSKGAEFNLSYNPLKALSLSANVVYADAKFTKNFQPPVLAGDQLTRAPKWSGRVGADYKIPFYNGTELFTGASLAFQSKSLLQLYRVAPTSPYTAANRIVDAHIGIRGENDKWEISLLGTNLTDKRVVSFVSPLSGATGAFYGSYNQPRVVTIQLTLKH